LRPHRFGVMLWRIPGEDWVHKIRRLEELGYSSIMIPDHPNTQWCPIATQAAIASVTEKIKVGSMVFNMDFHHPVVLAKASATIQNLSRGRHEFGIGAGWDEPEYHKAGIRFDEAATRVARMEEAIQVIQRMWVNELSSFEGKHYNVHDIPQAASHMHYGAPKTMLGAGGKRTLRIAGRYADIVNVIPRLSGIKVSTDYVKAAIRDPLTFTRLNEKMGWVRESAKRAGRDPDNIEYSYQYMPGTEITDDPESAIRKRAKLVDVTTEDLVKSPNFFFGILHDLRADIEERYEATGIGYHVIPGNLEDFTKLEEFAAEVIKPLSR
jgi:probable F420-dependent oxidoreductase